MLHIQDRFFLSVVIDGKDYPIEDTGFGFFQLTTNMHYFLPVARIQLNDPHKIFKEIITLADQTPVEITVGTNPGSDDTRKMKFRVFDFQANALPGNMVYTIDMIFDNIKYMSDSRTQPLMDAATNAPIHSYEAIQKIATECGFQQVKTSKTNDRQVWIPGGVKTCMFAKEIADYGYVDEYGCMVLCVTADNTLKYMNISEINKKVGVSFTHQPSSGADEYHVAAVKEVTKNGLLNNLYGHSQRTVDQTNKTEYRGVAAKIATTNLMLNSEINSSINPRTLYTPVDCGNTHANYFRAKHQNTRIKSLYSFAIHASLHGITNLDLLDVVQYSGEEAFNASGVETKPQLAGAYLVTGKTLYITGNGFPYEKFELTRAGLNDDVGKTNTQLS